MARRNELTRFEQSFANTLESYLVGPLVRFRSQVGLRMDSDGIFYLVLTSRHGDLWVFRCPDEKPTIVRPGQKLPGQKIGLRAAFLHDGWDVLVWANRLMLRHMFAASEITLPA
jgi:hypothetical protein